LNKRHIKQGDTIVFCDLDCKEVYGEVIVKDVNILSTSDLFDEMYSGKNNIKKIEKETFTFIERNYIDEDYILEFVLERIKTPR
jgi:ASC-1-like (ASCH) protein